jgi:hypothetical protein
MGLPAGLAGQRQDICTIASPGKPPIKWVETRYGNPAGRCLR